MINHAESISSVYDVHVFGDGFKPLPEQPVLKCSTSKKESDRYRVSKKWFALRAQTMVG
jgi:hypothetical protein